MMTAAAGTSIGHIKSILDENNQQLAFEPPDIARLYGTSVGSGTLGGVLSCNLAGPRRIHAGAARIIFTGLKPLVVEVRFLNPEDE